MHNRINIRNSLKLNKDNEDKNYGISFPRRRGKCS